VGLLLAPTAPETLSLLFAFDEGKQKSEKDQRHNERLQAIEKIYNHNGRVMLHDIGVNDRIDSDQKPERYEEVFR